AMPRLSQLDATTTSPGLRLPAVTIAWAVRSLALPPGLKYSSFAHSVKSRSVMSRSSRTRGVLPMVSAIVRPGSFRPVVPFMHASIRMIEVTCGGTGCTTEGVSTGALHNRALRRSPVSPDAHLILDPSLHAQPVVEHLPGAPVRDMLEGDTAVVRAPAQLGIDPHIIKPDPCGLRCGIGEIHLPEARPVHGPGAHRTRLGIDVELAPGEIRGVELTARRPDGDHLRMVGGILRGEHSVVGLRDDAVTTDNDRPEGTALTGLHSPAGQLDGALEKVRVHGPRLCPRRRDGRAHGVILDYRFQQDEELILSDTFQNNI